MTICNFWNLIIMNETSCISVYQKFSIKFITDITKIRVILLAASFPCNKVTSSSSKTGFIVSELDDGISFFMESQNFILLPCAALISFKM